jgi:hypothetical protein
MPVPTNNCYPSRLPPILSHHTLIVVNAEQLLTRSSSKALNLTIVSGSPAMCGQLTIHKRSKDFKFPIEEGRLEKVGQPMISRCFSF